MKGLIDGIVIAGTTEGREVVEALNRQGLKLAVTVATSLGRQVLDHVTGMEHTAVFEGRRDVDGFRALFERLLPRFVVDASHPFAVEVSRTVKDVCQSMDIGYVRYLRTDGDASGDVVAEGFSRGYAKDASAAGFHQEDAKDMSAAGFRRIYAEDAVQAAGILRELPGNILLTTGANTAGIYLSEIPDFNDRCYIRVLDTEPSVGACLTAGVVKSHIIAAYPPFSCADNLALLKRYDIQALVTKDSGEAGGLTEKLESARLMGIPVILIRRPVQGDGVGSIEELKALMIKRGWMDEP